MRTSAVAGRARRRPPWGEPILPLLHEARAEALVGPSLHCVLSAHGAGG